MNASLFIGRIFGIGVRLHYLWILGLAAVLVLKPVFALILLPLFVVVFLHELGHSIVAQRFGIRVLDITLWPLGGMARMSSIPEDSRIEMLIAIAGPAVNFALAALTLPVLGLAATGAEGFGGPLATIALWFFVINLTLGTFNLIPAFPMDGGRVLRAWLARRGDWVSATERAVRVGRVFAVGMILTGLFWPQAGFMPAIIGLWILWVGAQEQWAVRLRHARSFGPQVAWAGTGAGAGTTPPPAPDWSSHAFGTRRRASARRAAAPSSSAPADDPATREREAAERAARASRPVEPPPEVAGWTAAEIERLERFRGPLAQYLRAPGPSH